MKNILKIAGVALLLTTTSAFAQHAGHGGAPKGPSAPEWTSLPMLVSGGGFSRAGTKYQAYNMHAMESSSYASYDGQGIDALKAATQSLVVDDNGAVTMKIGEAGGYYLVRVTGHGPAGEIATATTLKYFSQPGPAPRDLLNTPRGGFEIAPAVLPREHGHYREGEQGWPFIVRMDGKPMAGISVVLETSNGTKADYTTDAGGIVKVTIPEDFKDIPKDEWAHGRPPYSKFVIAARDGGLLATYNDSYAMGAFAAKNLWAGVGFAVLGMALAVPLVRRRKKA
ncbi:hypothetical protein ACFL12_00570 [Pseudomonadota bacterium]